VPVLVQALQTDNPDVRFEAAAALADMTDVRREEAVAVLAQALRDSDSRVQACAVKALASMGASARAAGPALRRVLRDTDSLLARPAAVALARVEGAAAVPALVEALGVQMTRLEALDALGEIGSAAVSALPAIGRWARADDPDVRQAAAVALRRIRGSMGGCGR
jgi:HEAT repeat protein